MNRLKLCIEKITVIYQKLGKNLFSSLLWMREQESNLRYQIPSIANQCKSSDLVIEQPSFLTFKKNLKNMIISTYSWRLYWYFLCFVVIIIPIFSYFFSCYPFSFLIFSFLLLEVCIFVIVVGLLFPPKEKETIKKSLRR